MSLGWSETTSRLTSRFWNDSCRWWYNKCNLPLKNNLVIQDAQSDTTHDGNWTNTTHASHEPSVSHDQHQSLLVGGILDEARDLQRDPDDGNVHKKTDNVTELRSYKIQMFPTREQKRILQLWMDAADWSYDQAVEGLERGGMNPYSTADMKKMKSDITRNDKVPESKAAFRTVPSIVRNESVRLAVKAKKQAMKKGAHLKLRLESRLSSRCAIVGKEEIGLVRNNEFIGPLDHPNEKIFFTVRIGGGIGNMALRDRSWVFHRLREESEFIRVVKGMPRIINGVLRNEALITYDRKVGKYHLVVRFDVPVPQRTVNPETARVVALDPGVRHFQTYYSPDGTHGELLAGGKKYIDDVGAKISTIQSNMDKEHTLRLERDGGWSRMSNRHWGRRRRHQRGRMRRLQRRLEGRRRNAHYNAANFLLSKYDVVVAPALRTRQMAEDPNRRIHQSTVRSMFGWAHYKFMQILKDKAQVKCDKYVRIGREPGTSGTCGRCGEWNGGLGASETFRCPHCNVLLDRDVNGARNNLLAELTHFIVVNNTQTM